MKEAYENISQICDKVCYKVYNWKLAADLNVVALLTGLQIGFIKYCCFLCEWNSQARDKHCIILNWPRPRRDTFTPGQKNVVHDPLVSKENIFVPPLHIKLKLMKQFLKTMNKVGEGFNFFK